MCVFVCFKWNTPALGELLSDGRVLAFEGHALNTGILYTRKLPPVFCELSQIWPKVRKDYQMGYVKHFRS